MDISKLSFHTQKAKKRIANALGLTKLEFKKKRVTLDPKKPLETIENILGKKINEKEIDTKSVIKNICGSDGAAKILANSMLTKNKKNKENEAGFKNLVSKTLETLSEDSFNDEKKNEDIRTKMRSYIKQKKRGVLSIQGGEEGSEAKGGSDREEGSEAKSGSDREESGAAEIVKDSKDAREIDWLKLLCALLVLYVIKAKEEEITDKSQTLITKERIDGANEFIKKEVTEITKESTTFYELKSEFERIRKIEAILQRDAVLQSLLEYIGECLNKTNFVSIPIELFLKANESLFSSIDKSTSDVLIGFFNKAQELAKKPPVAPTDTLQLMSDIDKGREEQLIRYLKDEIKIKKIRTVGNVNDTVKKKYVISQDGTELIIYPSLKNKDFLYVVEYLCKIENDLIKGSDYANKRGDFPESKLYDIDKRPVGLFKPDLLNAKTRVRLLLKWEDFLKEELTCVNSKYEYKTYGQIIEMNKDDRDKLFGELNKEITQCVEQLNGIGIQKIRTVGNVNDKVTKKYVISQDGTELIIYPSLKNKDFLYVVDHLCKIGDDSITKSDYANKRGDFPESKLYDIDTCPVDLFKPTLLNAQARERLLSKWADFLNEELTCVNSQDESKEYTYKQIIEMKEDDRNKLFGELYEIEKLRQEVKKN